MWRAWDQKTWPKVHETVPAAPDLHEEQSAMMHSISLIDHVLQDPQVPNRGTSPEPRSIWQWYTFPTKGNFVSLPGEWFMMASLAKAFGHGVAQIRILASASLFASPEIVARRCRASAVSYCQGEKKSRSRFRQTTGLTVWSWNTPAASHYLSDVWLAMASFMYCSSRRDGVSVGFFCVCAWWRDLVWMSFRSVTWRFWRVAAMFFEKRDGMNVRGFAGGRRLRFLLRSEEFVSRSDILAVRTLVVSERPRDAISCGESIVVVFWSKASTVLRMRNKSSSIHKTQGLAMKISAVR